MRSVFYERKWDINEIKSVVYSLIERRIMRRGRPPKGFNDYEIRGNVTAIFLEKRTGEGFETLIDTEDLKRLIDLNYCWHLRWADHVLGYYAKTTLRLEGGIGKTLQLHDLIMNTTSGMKIDHINHNRLDNRKINLRPIDNVSNLRHRCRPNRNNKSKYRNVSWNSYINKWIVQLQVNNKNKVLGKFDDVDDAGRFAEEMRKKYYGEFCGK